MIYSNLGQIPTMSGSGGLSAGAQTLTYPPANATTEMRTLVGKLEECDKQAQVLNGIIQDFLDRALGGETINKADASPSLQPVANGIISESQRAADNLTRHLASLSDKIARLSQIL